MTTKPVAPAEPYPTLEQRITHLVNTHYSEKVAGDRVKAQEALDAIVKMVRGDAQRPRMSGAEGVALDPPVGRLAPTAKDSTMSYPCANCNMDDGSPVCLRDARCLGLGPVKINNQTYTRPVIRVAKITMDGGASCVVPVGELLDCIEDGHEYSVQIKTMPLREFEAMPEFNGW